MRHGAALRFLRHIGEDERFRRALLADVDGALRAHGYGSEPDELRGLRRFYKRVRGLSPEELSGYLLRLADEAQDGEGDVEFT